MANTISSNSNNTFTIYDTEFDTMATYSVSLYDESRCTETPIDDVEFDYCDDYVKFKFDTPCLREGWHIMTIEDETSEYKKIKIWVNE